jgi:hypothetical protein
MTAHPKNKLLFIAFYYPPAGGLALPGSQRVVKFVRYLEKQSISVLTAAPDCYPSFISRDFNKKLPVRGECIFHARSYDPFEILLKVRGALHRLVGKKRREPPPGVAPAAVSPPGAAAADSRGRAQKLKDFVYDLCHYPDGASGWIVPAVAAGHRIIRNGGADILFATGMPWSSLVVAWLLHKISGVPYLVDFRDPWIGNPFHQSKGAFLDAVGQRLEKSIVERAALVSVNTAPLREEFLQRYPHLPPDKFVVLTNGFDPEDFDHLLPDSAGEEENGAKLVLAHAGFLYGKRDPAPLLDALELLLSAGRCHPEDILFLQMGQVQLDYDFRARYGALIEKGVVCELGQLSFDCCLKELRRADVLLLIQPGTKTQVPSKLYDYLCMNRPILTITPPDGALGTMVTEHSFGDLFDPDDVTGIAGRIEELLLQKKKCPLLYANYPLRDSFNVAHIARMLDDHLLRAAGN